MLRRFIDDLLIPDGSHCLFNFALWKRKQLRFAIVNLNPTSDDFSTAQRSTVLMGLNWVEIDWSHLRTHFSLLYIEIHLVILGFLLI